MSHETPRSPRAVCPELGPPFLLLLPAGPPARGGDTSHRCQISTHSTSAPNAHEACSYPSLPRALTPVRASTTGASAGGGYDSPAISFHQHRPSSCARSWGHG